MKKRITLFTLFTLLALIAFAGPIDPEKAGGDVQVLKKKLADKGVTQIAHFGPLYRFKIVEDMAMTPTR